MTNDVTFTQGHILILAAVFGPLLTAIGILFRSLLASKDAQVTAVARALEKEQAITEKLSISVADQNRELRELRQDLWKERRLGGRSEASS